MADEEKKYFKKLTFSNGTEAYVKDDEARNGISTLQGQISALETADETFSTDISDLQTSVGAISRSIQAIDISTAVARGSSNVYSLDDILLYALNTIDIMPKQTTITIEQENKKVVDGLHLTFSQNDIKIIDNEIEGNSVVGNDIINLSAEDIKLYNIDSLSKINVTTSENEIIDIFFGDGLKDKYILSATPILNDADKPIKVYLDGTPKTSGYRISNNEITFSDTPYPFGHIKVTYFTNDKKYNYSISDAQQSTNGVESLAIGKNSISNGNYSIAAGQNTVSSGVGSVALGYNTIASGDFQQVFGKNNEEDTENQYIEIVGNGGYKKVNKEEIFTLLTIDNNIELTENSIISINNIQTNANNYDLTNLIAEIWYSAQSIAASTETNPVNRSIDIVLYTTEELSANYSIPININISYKLGNANMTATITADLKDKASSEGKDITHNNGCVCETINCNFGEFTNENSSKAISNISITSIETNFTNNNNQMPIESYMWPYNNNKQIIKITDDCWLNYFKIPNFALIVNYTYENSEKKNGIPRSNARTLDWEGNEHIAGKYSNPFGIAPVIKLLWINNDPTSNFSAQTINLDLANYDAVCIITKSTASSSYTHWQFGLVGGNMTMANKGTTSTTQYGRTAQVAEDGITFSNGYEGSTSGAVNCIPWYIYGIRGIKTSLT